jgi:hypothetical protein
MAAVRPRSGFTDTVCVQYSCFPPLTGQKGTLFGAFNPALSQQGGELFSLLPFFRSRPQRYSSLD